MSRIEVVMPQMGESIAEGTIIKWHKKVGDRVQKDETLLEISTDKVDSEIPSPAGGVLAEIVVPENQTVAVRTVIAYLETDGEGVSGAAPAAEPPRREKKKEEEKPPSPGPAKEPEKEKGETAPPAPESPSVAAGPRVTEPAGRVEEAKHGGGRFYSPLVMNIARTEGISMEELERISGSGEGGRVPKKDLLGYVAQRKAAPARPADGERARPAEARREEPRPAPQKAAAPQAPGIVARPAEQTADLRAKYPAPGHEVLQMSNVLQKMAQHMVTSVQTSPHVAAIHEVDMTAVARNRNLNADAFEQREGFRLTFMPYIIDAVVRALKKYPLVNSSVDGDKIIRKNFINIGIAVASENGLIVPVIKHAEEKNFLGYARAVNDLAQRTRSKRLTPDDIQGGTFTITNYGVFGTMIGTPIINQPQVAILGTGAVTKRVAVVDDALAVRSIAYFTLSFDHRIVDGALGGMFMDEVVKILEGVDPSMKV